MLMNKFVIFIVNKLFLTNDRKSVEKDLKSTCLDFFTYVKERGILRHEILISSSNLNTVHYCYFTAS